jgi:hypothetical protein
MMEPRGIVTGSPGEYWITDTATGAKLDYSFEQREWADRALDRINEITVWRGFIVGHAVAHTPNSGSFIKEICVEEGGKVSRGRYISEQQIVDAMNRKEAGS